MSTPAVLEVAGLTKRFAGVEAVADLSFTLAPGEILGLVGPNGAGKTTTLRCISGIARPSAGSIRILGTDLALDSVGAKRALAYLPDEPQLFEYLTVREHLNFVARLFGVAAWEKQSEALLSELELGDRLNSLPSELSRGMRQKLLIACGLLHDPRLILLDEPLTGLDPMAIRRMKAILRSRSHSGAAIVVSSHLLPLVEELSGRILVLAGGRCVALGALAEIRDKMSTTDGSLEELFLRITAAPTPGGAA